MIRGIVSFGWILYRQMYYKVSNWSLSELWHTIRRYCQKFRHGYILILLHTDTYKDTDSLSKRMIYSNFSPCIDHHSYSENEYYTLIELKASLSQTDKNKENKKNFHINYGIQIYTT